MNQILSTLLGFSKSHICSAGKSDQYRACEVGVGSQDFQPGVHIPLLVLIRYKITTLLPLKFYHTFLVLSSFGPVTVLCSVARAPTTKWLKIRQESCWRSAPSFPLCNLLQWPASLVLQWRMLQQDHCTGYMTRQTLRNCSRKIECQSSGRRASHLSTVSQLGTGAATTMF